MVKLCIHGPQAALDIAQALPVRQLSEGLTQELIKACKRADALVAFIPLDTSPELPLRQKVCSGQEKTDTKSSNL